MKSYEFYKEQWEWERSAQECDIHAFFVDPQDRREWFHDCIDELLRILRPKVKDKKLLVVGHSMGGYGALLLAHLLGGASLSFSPQTDRSPAKYSMDIKKYGHQEWFNLTELVKGKHHHIYYGVRNEIDKSEAERMDCSLYPLDTREHNVALVLRGQGKLVETLNKHINMVKNG